MVTLLLTFFVMLLSLADMQDPELFNIGRDSFIEAIQTMGLGALYGSRLKVKFEYEQKRYGIENPEQTNDRTIDAEQEKIRRAIKKLNDYIKNSPPEAESVCKFVQTNIIFTGSTKKLNRANRQYIDSFADDINSSRNTYQILVLGTADLNSASQSLHLASIRASITADYLAAKLKNPHTKVIPLAADYSWISNSQTVPQKQPNSQKIWIAITKNTN